VNSQSGKAILAAGPESVSHRQGFPPALFHQESWWNARSATGRATSEPSWGSPSPTPPLLNPFHPSQTFTGGLPPRICGLMFFAMEIDHTTPSPFPRKCLLLFQSSPLLPRTTRSTGALRPAHPGSGFGKDRGGGGPTENNRRSPQEYLIPNGQKLADGTRSSPCFSYCQCKDVAVFHHLSSLFKGRTLNPDPPHFPSAMRSSWPATARRCLTLVSPTHVDLIESPPFPSSP